MAAAPPSASSASSAPGPSAQEARGRQLAFGLSAPAAESFIRNAEFVSLGCYCAVSEALLHLGLRQHAYPFDWIRSSMAGVIHCFETGFEDFLTYTEVREAHDLTCFAGARWGGSFWHHDLEDASVQADFSRRAERILGLADVPVGKPKVFVRLLNDSRELDWALRLRDALTRAFPTAPVYLLLIVDIQLFKGPKRLEGMAGEGLLVHFMDAATVYKGAGLDSAGDYQTRARVYAAVVAFAINYWSGGRQALSAVQAFPSLPRLCAACEQYSGGDPAHELYSPQYFKGHRLAVRRGAAPALPGLFHGKAAEFALPEGVVPGGVVQVNVFGEDVALRLPDNAVAGLMMKCRLVEGVLSAVMVLAASTAPAIATAACQLASGPASR